MPLPSVSVVIPTYRRRAGLSDVVSAIAADPYPIEIIVVVDGARDGSLELLRDLARDEPRLRPVWQKNAGEGVARQRGVEQATGEVVLLLDDDVVSGPGLGRGHARAHADGGGLVVVGFMPTRRPTRRAPGQVATYLYAEDYEATCRRYERDPASVLTHLWAGNLSLRRSDALRVGMIAPPGVVMHRDKAFGLRCLRAGLTGVFDRSLRAVHAHSRDLATFARQCRQYGASRRALHAAFPDLAETGDPRAELPVPLWMAVRAAAAPGVYRPVSAGLRTATAAAGRARLWPAETALARVLRQVEVVRGYRGRG